jgi:hypothetical protein
MGLGVGFLLAGLSGYSVNQGIGMALQYGVLFIIGAGYGIQYQQGLEGENE